MVLTNICVGIYMFPHSRPDVFNKEYRYLLSTFSFLLLVPVFDTGTGVFVELPSIFYI
jgi:hypothetical protein